MTNLSTTDRSRTPHSTNEFHVAIVGGGITGLSAAWYLQQAANDEGNIRYTLLEQSERWGGKVLTDEVVTAARQPFIIEAGPDSFITQKPWALELARELGMEERMLPTNDDRRKVFVLNKGRPLPMPDGLRLIVPTKILPFVRSPLLSPLGKLRMALDLVIPPRPGDDDETLATFITRRLGFEALDRLAEPLLAGIYNAESDRQSLLATFPRFRQLEKEHGSLIRGMLAGQQKRAANQDSVESDNRPPAMFISFQQGMGELITALDNALSGDRFLNTTVSALQPHDGRYRLILNGGESELEADAVLLAIPAYAAAALLQPFAPDAAAELNGIRYVSTGTISLGYHLDEIAHPLDGFGVVIPRSEQRSINAITWTSTKFDRRAPQGHALLRVFFGGSRRPEMVDVDDGTLLTIVCRELEQLMGITATPLFHRIYRWHNANPQYDVGHLQRVSAIEAALPSGIYVSGSPYRGVGIPDCIHQAQLTVQALLEARTVTAS